MSVANVKAFVEKLNSDETFRNQITSTNSDEARLDIARAAGFEFSLEEFWSTAEQLARSTESDELADDQLDNVAGGSQTPSKPSGLEDPWGMGIFGGGRGSTVKE